MNYSMPGFPVLQHLLELAQIHVHSVGDSIQPFHPLSSPSPPTLILSQNQGFFPVSQLFTSGGQSIGVSASVSVLPMNLRNWFLTGLISLQSKGTLKNLHQHHSSKASVLWCSAFFMVQLSHPCMSTRKTIALTIWTFVGKVMSLLFNMLSMFVIAFLPRSKHLLILCLQSPSAVILEPKNIKSVTVSIVSPSVCCEVVRSSGGFQFHSYHLRSIYL